MNYIGSKRALISFISDGISDVTGYKDGDNCIFGDLFAGTGIIGRTYKTKGCKVISNDLQYYSYVINKHYIENVPSEDLNEALLDRLKNLEPVEGFVYQNFCEGSGRKYFTDLNGKRCDAVRTELERLHKNGEISDGVYFYYLASLIDSIDRYANTTSVYGAYLKSFQKTALKEFELKLLPVIDGKSGEVHNRDVNELIREIKGDVLYLDPPYSERQYWSAYHVLETIARYDNPKLHGITGRRDVGNQRSDFCSKRKAAATFQDLIEHANFKYIFVSYNNEGCMTPETIEKIMSANGKYSNFTKKYRRFKADNDENRNYKANSTIEYLHCLEK